MAVSLSTRSWMRLSFCITDVRENVLLWGRSSRECADDSVSLCLCLCLCLCLWFVFGATLRRRVSVCVCLTVCLALCSGFLAAQLVFTLAWTAETAIAQYHAQVVNAWDLCCVCLNLCRGHLLHTKSMLEKRAEETARQTLALNMFI